MIGQSNERAEPGCCVNTNHLCQLSLLLLWSIGACAAKLISRFSQSALRAQLAKIKIKLTKTHKYQLHSTHESERTKRRDTDRGIEEINVFAFYMRHK